MANPWDLPDEADKAMMEGSRRALPGWVTTYEIKQDVVNDLVPHLSAKDRLLYHHRKDLRR